MKKSLAAQIIEVYDRDFEDVITGIQRLVKETSSVDALRLAQSEVYSLLQTRRKDSRLLRLRTLISQKLKALVR